MCDGYYRSAWPAGAGESHAEAERREHAWPEAGAKRHSLRPFMVLEAVVLQVGRGSCSHAKGAGFYPEAEESH